MLSVSILNLYAEGFESLVKLPKFSFIKKIKERKQQQFKVQKTKIPSTYSAEQNRAFEPSAEAAL